MGFTVHFISFYISACNKISIVSSWYWGHHSYLYIKDSCSKKRNSINTPFRNHQKECRVNYLSYRSAGMINQTPTKKIFIKGVILSGAFPREDLINSIRHCETSFFEVVAISSDTIPVILSPRFSRA